MRWRADSLRAAAWAAALACASAWAQVPPAALVPEDPAQRLLREQRQRELEREASQPPTRIETPTVVPADAPVESVQETSATFDIQRIEVLGNTVLSEREIEAITAPFVGHALGTNRINLLLRRFTEAFVAKGYITTRAYLGEQNLTSGVLVVTVVPGKVEAVTLNGSAIRPNERALFDTAGGGWVTDAGTAGQFPAPGDTLRLQDLEQGVDQINRLRRNRAELQIQPGQTPGSSIVALTNAPADRFRFNAGVDNYGSKSTGISRTRLGIDADNALGFQESLAASYVGTLDTNAAVISAAVPWGYNTFSYTGSVSEYQNVIGDTALLYGRTFGHTVGWNRVLTRSQSGRQAFDLTLTHRKTEREINNFELDPQRLTVLRAAWSGLRRFAANGQPGYGTAEVGLSRGLPSVNATRDPSDIRSDEAHAQFTKLDANVGWQLPLPVVLDSARLAWRSQVVGQWTNVALFGSEQIYAGGMSTVRGFREGVIAGDRGAYWRNELAWANAPTLAGLRMEPYLFLDGGQAMYVANRHWQYVSGTGAGLRLSAQWARQTFTSELLVGMPLAQPSVLGARRPIVLATLNWMY
ncbi:ShlB/FhaC/HecB family hemolysin secretion/activation protein [Cupriavidus pinatubonensis]|uniref:ShlB/FhaC/HecB family hemolysin secretion/activation protein n=1 Tax=Cupriavidus pinatubonensis TaxID=248026 RepID=UPI001C73341C|nr:ShlB/FhaC/HecB family hemolysin secretion/activation protein [Cupriavidus pinatubonensis]QYY31143.1 ShlB/FhaC/HecB family hemolysin secretion/activation protein [Cupriavidus pinatubonensis]